MDALRGLVMIIMALDHTRDFFHIDAMSFSPEDLAKTNTILFLTRWITHFCAPVFMFTAGIGAWLWLQGGLQGGPPGASRTLPQLSAWLWKRGLWLVFLELTALRFAFFLSLTNGPVLLTVLWALGWSMVALAFLVRIPIRWLAPLSLAVIALHNLADPIAASRFGAFAWLWRVFHQPGAVVIGGVAIIAGYPLIPWITVMAAGFCFGPVLRMEPATRRAWMLRIGAGMTLAFPALRALNVYGDPVKWNGTLLSFLRVTKYPPSLDFLLMTLGPALLVLAAFDGRTFSKNNPLIVFGKAPLFYFLAHFYTLHLLAFPLALLRYGRADFLWNPVPSIGGQASLYPAGYGYALGGVYLLWISVVVAMYPLCVWFNNHKGRTQSNWVRLF